jgi:hypothetical protein
LWLIALYLLVPLLATWYGAQTRPIFNERYVIAAVPGLYLLVAAATSFWIDRVRGHTAGQKASNPALELRHWPATVLTLVLLSGMVLSLGHYYYDPAVSKTRGWRTLAAVMARFAEGWPAATTRVAQTYPDPTLWYYYEGASGQFVMPPAPNDEAGAKDLVQSLVEQDVQRVVLAVLTGSGWDDHGIATRTLQGAFRMLAEIPLGDWRVQVYDRPPRAALTPYDARFTNGVRLGGYNAPAERLVPGDVFPIYLRWEGSTAALTGGEKITLQLLNAQGRVAAQVDQAFGAVDLEASPAGYAISLPRTLPAGSYRLLVALYDASSPEAPRILTEAGGDHAVLEELSSP